MAHQHRIPKTTAFLEDAGDAAGFTMERIDPTPFLPPAEDREAQTKDTESENREVGSSDDCGGRSGNRDGSGSGSGKGSSCDDDTLRRGVTGDLSELVAMPTEGRLFRLYVCRKRIG